MSPGSFVRLMQPKIRTSCSNPALNAYQPLPEPLITIVLLSQRYFIRPLRQCRCVAP